MAGESNRSMIADELLVDLGARIRTVEGRDATSIPGTAYLSNNLCLPWSCGPCESTMHSQPVDREVKMLPTVEWPRQHF